MRFHRLHPFPLAPMRRDGALPLSWACLGWQTVRSSEIGAKRRITCSGPNLQVERVVSRPTSFATSLRVSLSSTLLAMLSSFALLAVASPLLVSARALAPRDISPALVVPKLAGCPVATEYSCENTTAIANTCCSPTPGGLVGESIAEVPSPRSGRADLHPMQS